MVSLYQHLDKCDQEIIAPVLRNNCYFCHPENILLAAVADGDQEIRKVAYDKISLAQRQTHRGAIRIFDKDEITLNLSATSFMDLIDWNCVNMTVPPLLQDTDAASISANLQIILPNYPCHSQAVERCVKDMSSACSKVYGHDSRHGVMLQMKKSRLDVPAVNTKANFL